MMLAIILALAAILRRDITRHQAWMMRGYAIAVGAGTQAFTLMPWILIAGEPSEFPRALLMGAGWVINLAVAEWFIRRRPPGSITRRAVQYPIGSAPVTANPFKNGEAEGFLKCIPTAPRFDSRGSHERRDPWHQGASKDYAQRQVRRRQEAARRDQKWLKTAEGWIGRPRLGAVTCCERWRSWRLPDPETDCANASVGVGAPAASEIRPGCTGGLRRRGVASRAR